MHYRQTHTGALAHFFSGEKGIEDPLERLWEHAVTGILNRETDIGATLQVAVGAGRDLVDIHGLKANLQYTAGLSHRMLGIDIEVQHDLMNLGGIGEYGVTRVYQAVLDVDGGRQ